MPERLDLMISSSITERAADAARTISGLSDGDQQVAKFIHTRGLSRQNHRCCIQLIDNGGAGDDVSHIQPLALIDRTIERHAAKTSTPHLMPRLAQWAALITEFRECNRRQATDAAQAERNDFHRFIRRDMAEHAPV